MSLNYLPWVRPAEYDDRPCVRDEHEDLTYAEFATRVEAAAEQFAAHGVHAGSTVAIMLPNRAELLVAIVAAWRLGAAATPINPVFTANEADYQINDADAVLVVNVDATSPNGGRSSLSVDELRRTPRGESLPAAPSNPEDIALLIYTSGSTGRPKGVMLSHGNLDAMAQMMVDSLRFTAADHCLLVLPLFHVNAICVSFLTTMVVGAQLSVLSRFHPLEFLQSIETLRPTYFSAVPTIYAHLVSLPQEVRTDTSSLRFGICGAAPASRELLTATEERFGFPLIEGYGLTEGTCASTVNPLDGPRKLGTVGVALPGQTVAIMGEHGQLLPPGERGEVVIQGSNVMQGYLNRPDATAEALGDGWLHTGDVGVQDEDGYLRLVDRIKDMIIRGGENLYPKEIENVLHRHPAVLEAAVVGVPHDAYGEVPVAYVATYPEASVDEAELLALCVDNLTKVKVPVAIHVLPTLPKNPVGKLDKPALRDFLATAPTTTPQGA
jgi:long-chain acyl-CoA synthetase